MKSRLPKPPLICTGIIKLLFSKFFLQSGQSFSDSFGVSKLSVMFLNDHIGGPVFSNRVTLIFRVSEVRFLICFNKLFRVIKYTAEAG
jgi:hypothetical protein